MRHECVGITKAIIGIVFLAAVMFLQPLKGQPSSQSPVQSREQYRSSLRELAARGTAYHRKGDYDNAIKSFDQVIRQQPTSVDAYISRGAAYHAKGLRDKALSDFNRAIRLNPKSARAYCDRADLEDELLGQPAAALADYDKAIQLASNFQRAYFNRGAHFVARHEYGRAIADFTRAIELMPKDFSTYAQRAYAYARQGARALAVADANVAIRLKPEAVFYLWRANDFQLRAKVYRVLGQMELALHDLQAAARAAPEDSSANEALAWFHATCPEDRFRNGTEAVSFASKACQMSHSQEYDCKDTLAAAHAEAGDFDEAVKYEKQAVNDSSIAPKEREQRDKRLVLFQQRKPFRDEF